MTSEKDILYENSLLEQCKQYLYIKNHLAYWSFSNKLLNQKDTNIVVKNGYDIDINKQYYLAQKEQLNELQQMYS